MPAHWKQRILCGDGKVSEQPAQLFQGDGFIEMIVKLDSSSSVKATLLDEHGKKQILFIM